MTKTTHTNIDYDSDDDLTNKKEEYECIKDINICQKFKDELVRKEERTIFGIKKSSIGYIAALLGTIGFLPIIVNIYKTKKTNNFTFTSIAVSYLISAMWVYYGIHEKSNVTIFRSLSYICIYSYILYIKLIH